ncbi:MAG: hypothetical protein ACRDIX_07760 [Actinomycetota bacterium]
MADIAVERTGANGQIVFDVRVMDGSSESRHEVTLSEEDYRQLGEGYDSPEEFVTACFEFLLAREPKESILSRFDVSVISRYFPDFEEAITRG